MADFGGMSADQINAGMGFGPGGVGAQGQALLNNNFGNFGQQTDYYSGLGAAYGRGVGEPSGMGSVFDQSAYGGTPAQPFQNYGVPAGMSPSDWAIFSRTVGPEAANAWATQRGMPTNASPSPQGLLGYTPSAPGAQLPNGFGYPGATPPSQMFNPNTFAPSQQQSSSGGGVPAGMSASDWATFSRAVGADAANAWAAKQGGGFTPAGLSSDPRDMSASDFSLLGTLNKLQNRPDLNTENMPQISNDFYTSTNPGFGSSDRFNMQTTQPPVPIQGSSGIPRFGGGGYSVIPPYGGEGDQDTINARPQVMEGRS